MHASYVRDEGWPLAEHPCPVEVDADSKRLLVSAKEQVVLRFGKASITLTTAGKALVQLHLCAELIFGCQLHQGRFSADQLRMTASI